MSTAGVPTFTTNDGVKIPGVSLGCWMGQPDGGEHVYAVVKKALEVGYRHIDTTSAYSNEEGVGRAIRESSIPRSEIFITTKLINGEHIDVHRTFNQSLAALGIEYIDLYLIHWPQAAWGSDSEPGSPQLESPTFVEAWLAMEKLLQSGKVRAIGVSNFGPSLLQPLLSDQRISVVPACNQVELYPSLPSPALQELCAEKGVVIMAYSPIGQAKPGVPSTSPVSTHPTVTAIAEAHNSLPTQVILSWTVMRRIPVILKKESEPEERPRVNIIVRLLPLTAQQISILDALQAELGNNQSSLGSDSESPQEPGDMGLTYEELMWEETGRDVARSRTLEVV